jgi:hypothetical protein
VPPTSTLTPVPPTVTPTSSPTETTVPPTITATVEPTPTLEPPPTLTPSILPTQNS